MDNLHRKLFFLLVVFLPSQLALHFWPDWSLVLGIRVDYLAPTIYLTDIIILGLLVSWGKEHLRKFFPQSGIPASGTIFNGFDKLTTGFQFSNLYTRPNVLFIGLFFAYLLLNTIFIADNKGVAIYKFIKIIEFSLLGVYVSQNWSVLKQSFFKPALVISLIYTILISLVQFLTGKSTGGLLWFLGERSFSLNTPGISLFTIFGQEFLRPYGTFPHPNVLAGFLLVSLLLLLDKKLSYLIFIAISILLAITYSQAIWLAWIVVVIFFVLQRQLLPSQRRVLFSLFLISIAILNWVILSQQILLDDARRVLVDLSFKMINQNLLAGVGLNNFISNLPLYSRGSNFVWILQPVHNIFMLMTSEIGLIGMAFLCLFFVDLLKKIQHQGLYLQLILLVILLAGSFDHYWITLQQPQILVAIVVGMIYSGV